MDTTYFHRTKQSSKGFRHASKYGRKIVKEIKNFPKGHRKSDYEKNYEDFSDESDTDCEGFTEEEKFINDLNDERLENRQGGHLSYSYFDNDIALSKISFTEKHKAKNVDYSTLPFKILKKLRSYFGLTTTKKTQLIEAISIKICEKPSNDVDILKQFLLSIS